MTILLRLDGISRHFGRRAVLQDVDLEITRGERIALLGPNGSGKTTLLRIAAGTLRPTGGQQERDALTVGYLPQEAPTYRELSVMDHLRFVAKVHGSPLDRTRAITDLRHAGLVHAADRPAGTLSRGQRQRLGLLLATQGDPDLLLLDEPGTALDSEGIAWMQATVAGKDAAVLSALHDPDLLPADRTITLKGGRIA